MSINKKATMVTLYKLQPILDIILLLANNKAEPTVPHSTVGSVLLFKGQRQHIPRRSADQSAKPERTQRHQSPMAEAFVWTAISIALLQAIVRDVCTTGI